MILHHDDFSPQISYESENCKATQHELFFCLQLSLTTKATMLKNKERKSCVIDIFLIEANNDKSANERRTLNSDNHNLKGIMQNTSIKSFCLCVLRLNE
jgi:hypothetical protein